MGCFNLDLEQPQVHHRANNLDLLMQPNLNSAIVKGAELHRRQEDSAKAAAKREKDKNDLRKQKYTIRCRMSV